MIDIALGSDINPISNTKLEMEILIGDYLRGIIYPIDYINLLIRLSKLPMIELITDSMYLATVLEIQKLLKSDPKETLDKEEIIKIYNKKSKIPFLIESLVNQSKLLSLELNVAVQQEHIQRTNDLITSMDTLDPESLGQSIDNAANFKQMPDLSTQVLQSMNQVIVFGEGILKSINEIQSKYIEDNQKIPKTIIDFKLYILEKVQSLQNVDILPDFLMPLMETLAYIEQQIPQDELDPWKLDVFFELIQVLRNPKKFYSYIKQDKIIDGSIGEAVGQLYPETYNIATELVIDKLNSNNITYQKQIMYLNQCSLQQDNSELVSLCHTHLI